MYESLVITGVVRTSSLARYWEGTLVLQLLICRTDKEGKSKFYVRAQFPPLKGVPIIYGQLWLCRHPSS